MNRCPRVWAREGFEALALVESCGATLPVAGGFLDQTEFFASLRRTIAAATVLLRHPGRSA